MVNGADLNVVSVRNQKFSNDHGRFEILEVASIELIQAFSELSLPTLFAIPSDKPGLAAFGRISSR
jgi:hypothetical protein